MRRFSASLILGIGCSLAVAAEPSGSVVFLGMCDASAAAALDAEHFIVADDEENVLRVFRREGGAAIKEIAIGDFIGAKKKSQEADLEGAAQMAELTFWIGSHGRNAKGEESPTRQRFFATRNDIRGGALDIRPVGRPYEHLLEDLIADERLAKFGLKEAAALPPKTPGALNIEGLAATPDGKLLIGFRNPIVEGKALLVPLLNPVQVVEGERARLGAPIELGLGGLGVRSIAWDDGRYVIIAGAADSKAGSRLYEWTGGDEPPRLIEGVSLQGLNPEGVSFRRQGGKTEYLLLSDDGTRTIDGQDCKKLEDPSLKRFRGTVLKL